MRTVNNMREAEELREGEEKTFKSLARAKEVVMLGIVKRIQDSIINS